MAIEKKIVTPHEMRRIEKLALTQAQSESLFMDQAGKQIADLSQTFIKSKKLGKAIYILAGKGNNAGDAYTAGRELLIRGFIVIAFQVFPKEMCSPLCQNRLDSFQKQGGRVVHLYKDEPFSITEKGPILDGLLGTGAQGKVEGLLAETILKANLTKYPILAIDIPSGLDGTNGKVLSVAIKAEQTFYLGLPKLGFFLNQGRDHTGTLIGIDFGLSDTIIEKAVAEAHLIDETKLELPPIYATQHKYQRGYVLGVAGSEAMNGAAILASLGALRGGAGIIRLFHRKEMNLLSYAPEIIYEKCDISRILEECTRGPSLFIGPGLGRDKQTRKFLNLLLPQILQPVVIDADALFFLAENLDTKLPYTSILTPHRKEMERLLQGKEVTLPSCQDFVEKKNVTLVLKGMPTIIFHPKTKPLIVPKGDPGMATAGSGDILAGIIAAFLARKIDPLKAATLGVYLHASAGEFAAKSKTSYCLIASDILEALPFAFIKLIPT